MPHQPPIHSLKIALVSAITLGLVSCHIASLLGHWRALSYQGQDLEPPQRFAVAFEMAMICGSVLLISLLLIPLIITVSWRHRSRSRLVWLFRISTILLIIALIPNLIRWSFDWEGIAILLAWIGFHGCIALLADAMAQGNS